MFISRMIILMSSFALAILKKTSEIKNIIKL